MNKLGYGFLHLPMDGDRVDFAKMNHIVDAYMAGGGNYFDTAYPYLGGQSEEAIRRCVVERYPRESYRICNKLPGYRAGSYEDCWKYFHEQQRRCGLETFDVFMLHWLNATHYAIAEEHEEFRFLQQLKEQGLAGRIGFSYHDSPELLDEILTRHPQVDCVLMQLNYLDWESPSIQSRRCYEVAVSHGVSVMVMEPNKGGTLVTPPESIRALLREADPHASPATLAVSFAKSLPGVEIVLSGMGSAAQVEENLAAPEDMSEGQRQVLLEASEVLRSSIAVPCTGCGYCLEHCPQRIPIPRIFSLYNDVKRIPGDKWKIQPIYARATLGRGRVSDCLQCRSCVSHCPQKLSIPDLLPGIAQELE